MGYSCSQIADLTMRAISEACIASTGSSNTIRINNKEVFFENGRENNDGAITGSIFDMNGKRLSGYRIDPDTGVVVKGPAWMKKVKVYHLIVDGMTTHWPSSFGEPNQENLWKAVLHIAKQYEIGGINAHVSKVLGYIPYPKSAMVVDGPTNQPLAEWKATPFQVYQ